MGSIGHIECDGIECRRCNLIIWIIDLNKWRYSTNLIGSFSFGFIYILLRWLNRSIFSNSTNTVCFSRVFSERNDVHEQKVKSLNVKDAIAEMTKWFFWFKFLSKTNFDWNFYLNLVNINDFEIISVEIYAVGTWANQNELNKNWVETCSVLSI